MKVRIGIIFGVLTMKFMAEMTIVAFFQYYKAALVFGLCAMVCYTVFYFAAIRPMFPISSADDIRQTPSVK